MAPTSRPCPSACNPHLLHPRLWILSRSRQSINFPRHSTAFCRWITAGYALTLRSIKAVSGERKILTASAATAWDEKPFEVMPNGKKLYLDELDVVTFLDPPKELIPLEPKSYHPAAYLWKKIEDIPEERRHRLLYLLSPRHISAAWQIAGTRYDDAKLTERCSSSLLCGGNNASATEYWYCRKSGGPLPFALVNHFKKALFHKDGETYGRLIGTSFIGKLTTSWSPLYFSVSQLQEVMPTEQPCDLAYEFGDGLLDLHDYPEGFPRPAKHPWPFNDQVVIYIRHVGPGVMVGQPWQEGLRLEQVPKKLCSEILMVKDYGAVVGHDK